MGKPKNKTVLITALLLLIAVIFTVLFSINIFNPSKVRAEVTIEAGGMFPDVEAFLTGEYTGAGFVTDISTIDTHSSGSYPVMVHIGTKTYQSAIRVVDTIPPMAEPVDRTIVKGETPEPDAFVTDIVDVTVVSVSYKSAPDFSSAGVQQIKLVLEDVGGNNTELTANLNILDAKPIVSVEAGTDARDLSVADFIEGYDGGEEISVSFNRNVSRLNLLKPTEYIIEIIANGILLTSKLMIIDTTPPSATEVHGEIWYGETIGAGELVEYIVDVSEVRAYFAEEPDYAGIGEQAVRVVLEDEYGNKAEVISSLTIKLDTEPPMIEGAANQTILLGDKISYRNGVKAEDNRDGDVELIVDSSSVNPYELGDYPVVYSAVDSSGNRAEQTITLTIVDMDPEIVYEMADKVLASIITEDMSPLEKATKIHIWGKRSIRYTSAVDKDNTIKGAFYGFKTRQGDCFTFYAVSEVLLTRAGIENMRVTRVGGSSQHFWNLINIGTGWYHFDTCPTNEPVNTFMFTDSDAEEYTQRFGSIPNYYVYDKSLYPEVVLEE